eukprot:scaffold1348_cov184-Ochromonas_danica.AAC.4
MHQASDDENITRMMNDIRRVHQSTINSQREIRRLITQTVQILVDQDSMINESLTKKADVTLLRDVWSKSDSDEEANTKE